jgi:hypothetical protein
MQELITHTGMYTEQVEARLDALDNYSFKHESQLGRSIYTMEGVRIEFASHRFGNAILISTIDAVPCIEWREVLMSWLWLEGDTLIRAVADSKALLDPIEVISKMTKHTQYCDIIDI